MLLLLFYGERLPRQPISIKPSSSLLAVFPDLVYPKQLTSHKEQTRLPIFLEIYLAFFSLDVEKHKPEKNQRRESKRNSIGQFTASSILCLGQKNNSFLPADDKVLGNFYFVQGIFTESGHNIRHQPLAVQSVVVRRAQGETLQLPNSTLLSLGVSSKCEFLCKPHQELSSQWLRSHNTEAAQVNAEHKVLRVVSVYHS